MTPSKTVKTAGLKSLAEMVELTGVPRRTLEDWHRSKRQQFDRILALCVEVKSMHHNRQEAEDC